MGHGAFDRFCAAVAAWALRRPGVAGLVNTRSDAVAVILPQSESRDESAVSACEKAQLPLFDHVFGLKHRPGEHEFPV